MQLTIPKISYNLILSYIYQKALIECNVLFVTCSRVVVGSL